MHSPILVLVRESDADSFKKVSEVDLANQKSFIDYVTEEDVDTDWLSVISKDYSKHGLMTYNGNVLTIHNPEELYKYINKQSFEVLQRLFANKNIAKNILDHSGLIAAAVGEGTGGMLIYDTDDCCLYSLKTWLYWQCKNQTKEMKYKYIQSFDYHW